MHSDFPFYFFLPCCPGQIPPLQFLNILMTKYITKSYQEMFSTQVWMCIYSGLNFIYYSKFGQIHTPKKPAWLLSGAFPDIHIVSHCTQPPSCTHCVKIICFEPWLRPDMDFKVFDKNLTNPAVLNCFQSQQHHNVTCLFGNLSLSSSTSQIW